MPVSGNPYAVLKKALNKTVSDRMAMTRAMAGAVKQAIKDQFAFGVDPYGKPQPERVDGNEAFVSKRLGNAVRVTPVADGVQGLGELKENKSGRARRQWLDAHQQGHTFPARNVSAGSVAFNARGQRIKLRRLKGVLGKATKRVTLGEREAYWREQKRSARLLGRTVAVRAHTVKQRVLKVRLIYPNAGIGARWGGRIKTATSAALAKQLQRNVERG